MSFINYKDVKPKNMFEFSNLYKKANKSLNRLRYQFEEAYNRPLNRTELKHIFNLHFKIKHMAENYKYLEEKLAKLTSDSPSD